MPSKFRTIPIAISDSFSLDIRTRKSVGTKRRQGGYLFRTRKSVEMPRLRRKDVYLFRT